MQRATRGDRFLVAIGIEQANHQDLLGLLVGDEVPLLAAGPVREVTLGLVGRGGVGDSKVRRPDDDGHVIFLEKGPRVAEGERVAVHALQGPPDGEQGPARTEA